MSRLSELVAFKELWESRKEKCEDAVKFYNEEITKISKEENTMIGKALTKVIEGKEDKLTVAQEASNFGYQAIQGIVSANEDKEGLKKDDPVWNVPQKKVNSPQEFYDMGWKDALHGQFNFSDFDTSVKRTWKDQNFKDAVSNAALGLTGEAGEVADLVKKAIYHGRGFSEIPNSGGIQKKDVKDELSDVLFYVSAMAQEFGFTLEEVARHNKEKLERRYKKGFTVEESAQKRDKKIVVDVNNCKVNYGGN